MPGNARHEDSGGHCFASDERRTSSGCRKAGGRGLATCRCKGWARGWASSRESRHRPWACLLRRQADRPAQQGDSLQELDPTESGEVNDSRPDYPEKNMGPRVPLRTEKTKANQPGKHHDRAVEDQRLQQIEARRCPGERQSTSDKAEFLPWRSGKPRTARTTGW